MKIANVLLAAAMAVGISACSTTGKVPEKKQAQTKAKAKAKVKAPAPYEIRIQFDNSTGIYKVGDTVKFKITFKKDGKNFAGQRAGYSLDMPGNKTKMQIFTTAASNEFQFKLEKPGSVMVEAAAVTADGKIMTYQQGKATKRIVTKNGVIASPEQIRQGLPEPADFKKFWDDAKAELAKIPVKAKLEKIALPKKHSGKFNAWDVKVDCIGGVPVSGCLSIPKNAKPKSLPARVYFHGAGVYTSNPPCNNNKLIEFDVNAHGILNRQKRDYYQKLSKTLLAKYPHKNADNRDKFYFRNMFLRVQRALDYVKTLPEWDGKNLIVYGGSQGGAQALVAGGLDPQVTLIYAGIPALSDHGGILVGRESGWPRLIKVKKGKPVNPAIVKTAPYYDVANFAKYIKGEAHLTVGLVDKVCVPTSVYAAYNNIPGEKTISVVTNLGHAYIVSRAYEKRLKELTAAVK